MTTHSSLYVGDNTHVIEALGPNGQGGLQDHLGVVQTDATVTMTALVDKRTGATVTGVTLPLAIPHVAAGLYRATIAHGLSIVVGRTYLATIKAIGSQGFRAEWVETLIAEVRRA